jgi:hypothetical protein
VCFKGKIYLGSKEVLFSVYKSVYTLFNRTEKPNWAIGLFSCFLLWEYRAAQNSVNCLMCPKICWKFLYYILNLQNIFRNEICHVQCTTHNTVIPFCRLTVYGSTALCWTLAVFSVSWSFYTVGRTPWKGDQPVARPLPAHRTIQTQNKSTQTFMSPVGFEPTIPASKRAKTVHALDRAATVIGPTDWLVGLNLNMAVNV